MNNVFSLMKEIYKVHALLFVNYCVHYGNKTFTSTERSAESCSFFPAILQGMKIFNQKAISLYLTLFYLIIRLILFFIEKCHYSS